MVSVIIPVYNASKWLDKTFRSVLSQQYLKEIICVDDHSTDGSLKILNKYQQQFPEKVKVFINPDKGSNTARNYGFLQSTGKYIQWLDADDQLLPGKLKTQVEFLEANPGCEVVYSDWYMDIYDREGKLLQRKEEKRTNYDDYLYELLKDNWSPPVNYLLRRGVAEHLHKIGQWNPETRVAQDREYFTIAALEGAKFCYVPGFFSVYNRWSSGQVSAMDFRQRLRLQMNLEKRFREAVISKNYPVEKKRKYLACLNAHVINANYYYPSIGFPFLFSIFNVNWQIVHWKKRLVAPMLYAYETIRYLLKPKR